jgi:hypothetical protein
MQTQFCWIRCGKCYNFCYTHIVRFLIFLTWKIGMWKTLICHSSKSMSPLYPSFVYVVCHVMTSSCAENWTKLWSKSFYMNCFPFM